MPPLAAPLLIARYHGPPELTLGRAFTSWTLDLPVLIVALLCAGGYVSAARRSSRSGRPWPEIRTVFFVGLGLGLVIVATMSSIGVYQNILFWVRAVQVVLLLLVVPLFLALGRPLTLLIAALPRSPGGRIEAALRGRSARILTFPLVTAALLISTPFLFYFTGWYAAGFHSDLVRELTYLVLIAPGFLFFWTLLRVDPVPREYPYLVSLWITGAEVVFDAFLGIAVIADQNLIAGTYYRALGRPWGPNLRTDQVLGGGALWILGDLVGLPFLAAMLIQMIREDEAEAAEIDAQLDARDAAAVSAAAGSAPAADAAAGAAWAGTAAPGAAWAGTAAAGAAWAGTAAPGTASAGTSSAGTAADSSAGGNPAAGNRAAGGNRAAAGNPAAGNPAAVRNQAAADDPAAGAAGDRPWWETDPRFADRFRASRPSGGQE